MSIGYVARRRALFAAVFVAAAATPVVASAQSWVARGPFGITGGQVEGNSGGVMASQGRPVSGAVEALLAHPTNSNVLFAATTNGGIWRTTNATATSPSWTPLTDDQSSLSMSSITFDRSDPTGNTIWAGNGRHSSLGRVGGTRAGLLKSTDGGDTWARVNGGGTLTGRQARAVVADGDNITLAVDLSDANSYSTLGLFRSINGGTTFSQLTGVAGTGLPSARAGDLVADPTNASVLYAGLYVTPTSTDAGIYRSADGGSTWARVSSAAINTQMASASVSKVRISVGNAGQVFLGVVQGGSPVGIYRSPDGTSSWTALDLPQTVDGGTPNGLNPRGFNPDRYYDDVNGVPQVYGEAGGQGSLHFSLAADPNNPNLVYVGGDRQPNPFPNSLGANDFSGRLFRVDASLAAGSQASSLTHRVGVSTTDNSSPHADSRSIVFDANGNLIQGDDGGVYRRTNPQGLGAWSGVIGNMQNTENHSIAYDSNTDTFIAGTQDVGTPESVSAGSTGAWRSVATADGGQVAVYSPAGLNSTRYSSFQNLGSFRRRVVNAANSVVSTNFPALTIVSTGTSIYTNEGSMPFYTPIAVSKQSGNLYIGARSAYESLDGGSTLTILRSFSGNTVTSVAAGADDSPGAVAFGTNGGTNRVFLRTATGGTLSPLPAYDAVSGAGSVVMLSISNRSFSDLAVVDSNQVFVTFNAGSNFTDITGTLISGGRSGLLSVAMASNPAGDIVFVGLNTGDVYYTTTVPTFGGLGTWTMFDDLPNAPVYDLEYNAADDVLVVGLLGRGVYSIANAAGRFSVPVVPEPAVAGLIPVVGLVLRRRR